MTGFHDETSDSNLKGALASEIQDLIDDVFCMLGFFLNRDLLQKAHEGLESKNKEQWANGLEILDGLMDKRMFDPFSKILKYHFERIRNLKEATKADKGGEVQSITDGILEAGTKRYNRWTVAMAINSAGSASKGKVENYLSNKHLVLSQTAKNRINAWN